MSSLSSSSSYDKTDKRELIRVDDESIETRRSAKLTRLISLGLNVKSSSASSENSSPSPSCSLSLFERRSLPAVLKATVLDVSLQFTASTKLNIFFEKVSKEFFLTFVGSQGFPSLIRSVTKLTQAHWMDSRYLVLLLITGIRKRKCLIKMVKFPVS